MNSSLKNINAILELTENIEIIFVNNRKNVIVRKIDGKVMAKSTNANYTELSEVDANELFLRSFIRIVTKREQEEITELLRSIEENKTKLVSKFELEFPGLEIVSESFDKFVYVGDNEDSTLYNRFDIFPLLLDHYRVNNLVIVADN